MSKSTIKKKTTNSPSRYKPSPVAVPTLFNGVAGKETSDDPNDRDKMDKHANKAGSGHINSRKETGKQTKKKNEKQREKTRETKGSARKKSARSPSPPNKKRSRQAGKKSSSPKATTVSKREQNGASSPMSPWTTENIIVIDCTESDTGDRWEDEESVEQSARRREDDEILQQLDFEGADNDLIKGDPKRRETSEEITMQNTISHVDDVEEKLSEHNSEQRELDRERRKHHKKKSKKRKEGDQEDVDTTEISPKVDARSEKRGVGEDKKPDCKDQLAESKEDTDPYINCRGTYSWDTHCHSSWIKVFSKEQWRAKRRVSKQTTDGVRGAVSFSIGKHLLQLVFNDKPWGSHCSVGVCTAEAAMQAEGYTHLFGQDAASWSWDIPSGCLYHRGVMMHKLQPDLSRHCFLYLDLDDGFIGMGVSPEEAKQSLRFSGVKGPVYPCVSMVYGRKEVEVRLISTTGLSEEDQVNGATNDISNEQTQPRNTNQAETDPTDFSSRPELNMLQTSDQSHVQQYLAEDGASSGTQKDSRKDVTSAEQRWSSKEEGKSDEIEDTKNTRQTLDMDPDLILVMQTRDSKSDDVHNKEEPGLDDSSSEKAAHTIISLPHPSEVSVDGETGKGNNTAGTSHSKAPHLAGDRTPASPISDTFSDRQETQQLHDEPGFGTGENRIVQPDTEAQRQAELEETASRLEEEASMASLKTASTILPSPATYGSPSNSVTENTEVYRPVFTRKYTPVPTELVEDLPVEDQQLICAAHGFDSTNKGGGIQIYPNVPNVCYPASNFDGKVQMIRCRQGFNSGRHRWQIRQLRHSSPICRQEEDARNMSNDLIIGVASKENRNYNYGFSLSKLTAHVWGWQPRGNVYWCDAKSMTGESETQVPDIDWHIGVTLTLDLTAMEENLVQTIMTIEYDDQIVTSLSCGREEVYYPVIIFHKDAAFPVCLEYLEGPRSYIRELVSSLSSLTDAGLKRELMGHRTLSRQSSFRYDVTEAGPNCGYCWGAASPGVILKDGYTRAKFNHLNNDNAGVVAASRALHCKRHVVDFFITGITEQTRCIIGLVSGEIEADAYVSSSASLGYGWNSWGLDIMEGQIMHANNIIGTIKVNQGSSDSLRLRMTVDFASSGFNTAAFSLPEQNLELGVVFLNLPDSVLPVVDARDCKAVTLQYQWGPQAFVSSLTTSKTCQIL